MATSLSLAQVEEELRAAETYLTQSSALAVASSPSSGRKNGGADGDADDTAAHLTDARGFLDKPRTRPVLSEERRKEILAKLSSERQAAMRSRRMDQGGAGHPTLSASSLKHVVSVPQPSYDLASMISAFEERSEDSPGRRSSIVSDRTSEGSVELFYASDVLGGTPTRADMTSLSHVLDDRPRQSHDLADDSPTRQEQFSFGADSMGIGDGQIFGSYQQDSPMTKLFRAANNEHAAAFDQQHGAASPPAADAGHEVGTWNDTVATDFEANQERRRVTWGPAMTFASTPPDLEHHTEGDFAALGTSLVPLKAQVLTRLDVLAQPRVDLFVEREKKRLQQEVESLRECTFKPNLTKQRVDGGQKTGNAYTTATAESFSHTEQLQLRRTDPGGFPWLSLSPRQKGSGRDPRRRMTWDAQFRTSNQNVIQRLHLDGTARYDLREQAKEALEAERLRSCTFKPAINPASRSLAFAVTYKPIHERVTEMQRAKDERAERVRERLALEEDDGLSFAPKINPKSREIAETVLAAKEADAHPDTGKSQSVTDRLAEDAENLLERRNAIQEYYDELTQQPYAPKISEVSEKIVKHRPEFRKLDFVARQDYFQSREQEKREALEDVCEGGQSAPFKPDIGNADEILQQLRPDLANESQEEKLYRLIYREPKNLELKKQKLREEMYAKCTFKPDINPVSKALGRPSTIDQLARPLAGLGDPDELPASQDDGRPRAATYSREELKKYFAGKRFRSKVALEMEQAERAECTFQPTLISSYKPRGMCASASTSKLASQARSEHKSAWKSNNLLHLIDARRQRKEEEMEVKRNALALKELEECTFRPNVRKPSEINSGARQEESAKKTRKKSTSSASPSPSRDERARGQEQPTGDQKPVIVRGLGRFLELRELAKKQQVEQRQREQRAFQPNASYEPRSYTVPKPFKLSESSKESIRRRLRTKEEMRAKEREECTFRPRTLESQKRKVLQHMLDR